jgi:hypothetical protein
MDLIYCFVLNKAVEKSCSLFYYSFLTLTERQVLKNSYTLLFDPLWNAENQKYLLGKQYIGRVDPEEDEVISLP